MTMLLCRDCGNFVRGVADGDGIVPVTAECPRCGGTSFRAVGGEDAVETDEEV